MSDEYCWQAVNLDLSHVKTWDGETVVYNERSGQTHLLSLFAALLLTQMSKQREPASSSSLGGQLAAEMELERDAEFEQALAGSLDQFEHLGLTERVPQRTGEAAPVRATEHPPQSTRQLDRL